MKDIPKPPCQQIKRRPDVEGYGSISINNRRIWLRLTVTMELNMQREDVEGMFLVSIMKTPILNPYLSDIILLMDELHFMVVGI